MFENILMRKANGNDIDKLMIFIKENWSSNHILANNRMFFEYQYIDENGVCFYIAEDQQTKKFVAILGYISYGPSTENVMLAVWKSIDKIDPFRGVELLQFLIENLSDRIVACCGINKKTIGIYQYLGYFTGELEHYYRLSDRNEYRVAVVRTKDIPVVSPKSSVLIDYKDFSELEKDFSFNQFRSRHVKTYKSPEYIKKRYFNHPIYTYYSFGIRNLENKVNTVLFAREQVWNDVKILRFVDIIGDIHELKFISHELERILTEVGYEYADFYQHGIPKTIMSQAGFALKSDTDNIIPNYFEPYVAENINIYYFTTDNDEFIICKADGDQDRPSYYMERKDI